VLIWIVILPIAKLHALSKLVTSDPTTRVNRLEHVTHMSPVGVSRTTAQFADALYQSYANNFSIIMSAEDGEKRAITDLKAQVKVLQSIEAKDPDNYQNPFVIARINNLIYEISKAKDAEANALAEVYGKKLLALSPSNVFGYLTLAETYVGASKFNEAIDLVNKAIILQPAVSETRSLLLNLYLISNQDDLFNTALVKAQNEIPGFVYTIPF
jgi:tetratricopeptide (TPR) repeat protein